LRFLAGLGEELDPEGVGGKLARPTQNMIQREALAEALSRGGNVTLGADGSMKIQQSTGSKQGQEGQQTGETPPDQSEGVASKTEGQDSQDTLGIDALVDQIAPTTGNQGS